MCRDRRIVIFILVLIDLAITLPQYDYNYRSDSESFEDFDLTEEDSYDTKNSHASLVSLFYYEKKPGDEGPPLVAPNGIFLFYFYGLEFRLNSDMNFFFDR